jgi:hypothetical protein
MKPRKYANRAQNGQSPGSQIRDTQFCNCNSIIDDTYNETVIHKKSERLIAILLENT